MRGRPLCLFVLAALVLGCGGGGQPAPLAPRDSSSPRITEITGITDWMVIRGSVQMAAAATDDIGVTNFKLKLDDRLVVDAALSSIVFTWDTRKEPVGEHLLTFSVSDAVGHTDTKKLLVFVDDGSLPAPVIKPPKIPIEVLVDNPAPKQMPVATRLVEESYTCVLPPMDPALYNPKDSGIPTLLLLGIEQGSIVYRTKNIWAMATDDTGINAISLLIDGHQLVLENGPALGYSWDTTLYEDGPHTVVFVMRDNGANLGQTVLYVTVDNTNDYFPPTYDLFGATTWSHDGLCGAPGDVYESKMGWYGNVTGLVQLRPRASDPSGVRRLELYISDELVAAADSGAIDYVWDTVTTCAGGLVYVRLTGEDAYGNASSEQFDVHVVNDVQVTGCVRAANGTPIPEAGVWAVPGMLSAEEQFDPDQAFACDTTSEWGRFGLDCVPCGKRTVVFQREEYTLLLPLELVLHGCSLGGEENERMPALYGPGRETEQLVVVTGADDCIAEGLTVLLAYFLEESEGRRWHTPYIERYLDSYEGLKLVDGDASLGGTKLPFSAFVRNLDQLYQYRFILIESGNLREGECLTDPAAIDALRGWVRDGGQLVCTNGAYDFVEQLFPEYIDFAGSEHLDGLGTEPEELNAAEVGDPFRTVAYRMANSDFQHGLEHHIEYDGNAPLALARLPDRWAAIDAVDEERVRVWLSAEARVGKWTRRPLVVSFGPGLGRVIFLSFPVGQVEPEAMTAELRILDGVLFEQYYWH